MSLRKDCVALLTIENLPTMNQKEWAKLCKWLQELTFKIQTTDHREYASPCRFRLMK